MALPAAAELCHLQAGPDGSLRLEGALTFSSVPALYALAHAHFAASSGALRLDLSGVESIDSAGLALLIDWLGWAQGAKRALGYQALPPALLALARLSEVETLLSA